MHVVVFEFASCLHASDCISLLGKLFRGRFCWHEDPWSTDKAIMILTRSCPRALLESRRPWRAPEAPLVCPDAIKTQMLASFRTQLFGVVRDCLTTPFSTTGATFYAGQPNPWMPASWPPSPTAPHPPQDPEAMLPPTWPPTWICRGLERCRELVVDWS